MSGNLYGGIGDDLVSLDREYNERWRVPDTGVGPIGQDGVMRVFTSTGLRGIATQDGATTWETTLPEALQFSTSQVLGADGTLYMGGSGSQQLFVFDKTGGLKWTYTDEADLADWTLSLDNAGNAYVVAFFYDDGAYNDNVPWKEAWLVSLDRAGAVRFRVPIDGQSASAVMVASDGTLVLGTDDGVIHRYSSTGLEVWRSAPDFGQPLALLPDGGIVYNAGKFFLGVNVAIYAHPLAAIDRAGNLLWQTESSYWQTWMLTVDSAGTVIAEVPGGSVAWDGTSQQPQLLILPLTGELRSMDLRLDATSNEDYYYGAKLTSDSRLLLFHGGDIFELVPPSVQVD